VARPRLTERLNAASGSPLTVLSAPAGFGKTTVLAEWLAGLEAHGTGVAWLSLDQRDNDGPLFWTYLATALHSAVDAVGAEALQLLASSSPSPAPRRAPSADSHR
jgi:LuxR family maltose regulon positive regulatory protein